MVAAVPAVAEGVGVLITRGLAVLAGAAAVNEAGKKVKTIDESKTSTIAEAGTQKKKESCKKCPPDCGDLVQRNWSMSDDSRSYQARITGFAPYTEWNFEGLDFDGFKSSECLLLEAKAKYDQFFDDDGDPDTFFQAIGSEKILSQAKKHSIIAQTNLPSRVHWHFMQPKSKQYFSRQFAKNAFSITTFLTP